MSPTQRARAFCKANGWTSQIVERFNVYAKVRVDLFGVIDLLVLDGNGGGPLAVQVCAGGDHAKRRTKALAEPRLGEWLASPARFEIWSFAKRGARGKPKRWKLHREPIVLAESGKRATVDDVW